MPIQPKRNLYAFGPQFLVACPHCSKRATLIDHGSSTEPDIVLTCSSCSFKQQWREPTNQIRLAGGWRRLGSADHAGAWASAPTGYAGSIVYLWVETSPNTTQKSDGLPLRLWLQTPCCGENLWYLNGEHLSFIESSILDPDRFRSPSIDLGNIGEKMAWFSASVGKIGDDEAVLSYIKVIRHESPH